MSAQALTDEEYSYLQDKAGDSSFFESLLDWYEEKHFLTERQYASLCEGMEREGL